MKKMNKNIHYKTGEIVRYFSSHRDKWKEFYPSERRIFRKLGSINKGYLGKVLDVGCACGGLASALKEQFIISSYTGVDINQRAIRWAKENRSLSMPTKFIAGDITELKLKMMYDLVVSLSCADWNIETNKIIETCWKKVRPGGHFVISLRLTPKKGINNIKKSYQYINYSEDKKKSEIANYVVFNFKEALQMIKNFSPCPELITAYGYWGKPSLTAVTPFNRLVFTVFAIKKSNSKKGKTRYELHWPLNIKIN